MAMRRNSKKLSAVTIPDSVVDPLDHFVRDRSEFISDLAKALIHDMEEFQRTKTFATGRRKPHRPTLYLVK